MQESGEVSSNPFKDLSLMSGHSPNSHHEMYEFKETHSTPASTSKECSGSDNVLKGSVLVDATDSVPVKVNNAYAALNNTNNLKYIDSTLPCIADRVPLAENENLPNISETIDENKDSSKDSDETKPDDTWSQKDDKEPENEEDLCLKCLYVSIKCCECTIM